MRARARGCIVAIGFVVVAAGTVPASAAAVVTVSRGLDGATVAYDFAFTRDFGFSAATPSGSGNMVLSVDGDAQVRDAIGGSQRARTYTFETTDFADVASSRWEDMDGKLVYALDGPTGRPVRAETDAFVTWTAAAGRRIDYKDSLNLFGLFEGYSDSLVPIVRFLDTVGGRSYAENDHIVEGPGAAMFATTASLQPVDLSLPGGRTRGTTVTALPLSFVLEPTGGMEVSGTVYLAEGKSLPVKLDLTYHSLGLGRDVGTLTMVAVQSKEGAELPELPSFRHPTTAEGAELVPPLQTGTRTASWAPRPTIEQALALARQTPTLTDYIAQYPGAYPLTVLHQDGSDGTPLAAVDPQARDVVDRAYGLPQWNIIWYAPQNPGIAVNTVIARDQATGQFVAYAQPGAGFVSTARPDRTLSVSSALELMERFEPGMKTDGTSSSLSLYIAPFNVWLQQRGPGGHAEAIVEDPQLLIDRLINQTGYVCAVIPPQAGTMTVLDGSGGVEMGVVEAHYPGPHLAAQERVRDCVTQDFVGVDPTDPDGIVALAGDARWRAERVATYADPNYRPHVPIAIDSDDDFTQDAEISGVVDGTGTRDDPYVIEGWNVRSPDVSTIDLPSAIYISGTTKHVLVRDNILQGDGIGLVVERARNVRIESNRFLGTNIGLVALGLQDGLVKGNTVDHNGLGMLLQNYIRVEQDLSTEVVPLERVAIRGNEVDDSDIGIAYAGGYAPFEDNVIADNVIRRGDYGLFTQDAIDTEISGNRYLSNAVAVTVRRGGDGVSFSGELVSGASDIGFDLTAAEGLSIRGTRFEDIAGYGVRALAASADLGDVVFSATGRALAAIFGSDVSVTDSAFEKSVTFGAYASDSTLDATGNYWSAPDGPGGCATGAGDPISCGVDAVPFLSAAPD